MTDWYRRKTWTKNDEEEFFLKLNRARKDSRAQYLKIQAIELLETQDKNLLDIAESLILKIFSDFPDNRIDKAQSLCTLGDIYRERKNFDKAMDYYKQAVKFEEEYPNVKTQAYCKVPLSLDKHSLK
jgi:tetratricopeptide (TPR) repeat protein